MGSAMLYTLAGFVFAVVIVLFLSKKETKNVGNIKPENVQLSTEVFPRGPSEMIERNPEIIPDPRLSDSVYPPRNGISAQYSNPSISIRDRHPVLAYQYAHSKGINPANIGDPIRVHNIGGGSQGLYGETNSFTDALIFSKGSHPVDIQPKGRDEDLIAGPGNNATDGAGYARRREAYSGDEGPYPGKPLNVPVPASAMKVSNEGYNPDMFRFSPLAAGTIGTAVRDSRLYSSMTANGVPLPIYGEKGWASRRHEGYSLPYSGSLPEVTAPGADFPAQTRPLASGDFFRPYGPNVPVQNVPFFGSVNSYAPFPEINTPWEKSGILTSLNEKGRILNLYRRPIAPLQDLWEYQVQDKNGFVIKLAEKYLENGDVIPHVTGKEGPWKVHDYVQNKYIWV
jgi:hypothetical protein